MNKIRTIFRNDIMKRKLLTRKRKEHIAAYLFILSSFLGIAVFYVVPYIICFIKSLYVGNTFVGMKITYIFFKIILFCSLLKIQQYLLLLQYRY